MTDLGKYHGAKEYHSDYEGDTGRKLQWSLFPRESWPSGGGRLGCWGKRKKRVRKRSQDGAENEARAGKRERWV